MAVGHGCVTKVNEGDATDSDAFAFKSVDPRQSYMGFHIKLHHSCLLERKTKEVRNEEKVAAAAGPKATDS